MHPSPVISLILASAIGVAGAVAVVICDAVLADVVGGAVALVALAVVTRSAIWLAGEGGAPDDTASQHR
jgi:hypothetical protein